MLQTLQFIWNHPISRHNRVAAYSRFLRWQIASRLLKSPVLVPFVGTTVLVAERSMAGATGNIYCGLHEFEDMGFVLHFLRSTDAFLDVGANVGSYSILASGYVGAHSKCIEPVPATFSKLLRNIQCNNLSGKITAIECAVGSCVGSIRFSVDQDTMNHVVSDVYRGEVRTVSMTTVDELVGEDEYILWKVDVEGFEREVLAGATSSLRRPSLKAVILEGHDTEILTIMQDAGFAMMTYDPQERQLKPGSKQKASNHLWVRDIDFAQNRCKTAQEVNVCGMVL